MLQKPKKKKWSISETRLDTLWRTAIYKKHGNRCAKCGAPQVEAHHIVRRAKKVLRWDLKNGLALCAECHRWADTLDGRQWVYSMADMRYLEALEQRTLKDFCVQFGISPDDFRKRVMIKLKEALE